MELRQKQQKPELHIKILQMTVLLLYTDTQQKNCQNIEIDTTRKNQQNFLSYFSK